MRLYSISFMATKTTQFKQEGLPYALSEIINLSDNGVTYALPIIFYHSDRAVLISREALRWSHSLLSKYSLSKIQAYSKALCRMVNFQRVWKPALAITKDNIDYLIYAFLNTRQHGTINETGECRFGGLFWQPASETTLKSDFSAIKSYFEFCGRELGYISLSKHKYVTSPNSNWHKRLSSLQNTSSRDFFAHLSSAREYWKEIYGATDLQLPPVIQARKHKAKYRHFPAEQEIWELIFAEKNPAFRALWTAAAFGGIRISEQLNAWQIDIRPARYRGYFFGHFDQTNVGGDILYLRADPLHSRYSEELGKNGLTRTQFLHQKYNLLPRASLRSNHPLYSGWKGTLPIGDYLTSEVFWTHPKAASLFEVCAQEIREFHVQANTAAHHPWFFVNLFSKGASFGQPIKLSRVEAAMEAAWQRIGQRPYRFGRNIHGLRHFYKWRAENDLEISPQHIQLMLGHSQISSQDKYGRNAMRLHQALNEKLGNLGAKDETD